MRSSHLRAGAFVLVAQFPIGTPADPPPTAEALVVLTADKSEFLIGENVLIHYCVENAAAVPFAVAFGGDNRGGTRSDRFKVAVTNQDGAMMPDPIPVEMNLGGAAGNDTLAPGARWCQSLRLGRYARIDQAGTYVVRVVHDLGWAKRPPPAGEISVAFVAPNEAQIDGIVAGTQALPACQFVMRRLSPPCQDYVALGHPIYLAALKRLAASGVRGAIEGLAATNTPEATRALVDLLAHSNRELAHDAAIALRPRMPPEYVPTIPQAGRVAIEARQQAFRDATWKPEFAAGIRTVMRTWLASDDPTDVQRATVLFRSLGETADVPALLAAIDRALVDSMHAPPREPGEFFGGPLPSLASAAGPAIRRGYGPPASPDTPAERLVWLEAFRQRARPAGWPDVYRRLLFDHFPYVRATALQLLPWDERTDLFDSIAVSLTSSEQDEQEAALAIVARAKLRQHAAAVQSLARTSRHGDFLGRVFEAVEGAAGLATVLDIAADRLPEEGLQWLMILQLTKAFEPLAGSSAPTRPTADEVKALAARWRTFIADHRDELNGGKRFALEDPAVTVGLIPAGWSLFRDNKPPWPRR